MTVIALQDAELAFGLAPLLDRASLVVQDGERIGLIGRNGTGKSSLLQALAGRLALDGGEIRRRDALTVAMFGSLVDHSTVRPESSWPAASRVVAVSCTVPASAMLAVGGDTLTDATGGGSTVTVATADFPPALAAMRTEPGATPVTTPSPETVAMPGSSVFQNTCGPESGFPSAPSTVTVRVVVAPIATVSALGEMSTDATAPLELMVSLLHATPATVAGARKVSQRATARARRHARGSREGRGTMSGVRRERRVIASLVGAGPSDAERGTGPCVAACVAGRDGTIVRRGLQAARQRRAG